MVVLGSDVDLLARQFALIGEKRLEEPKRDTVLN